MLDFADQPYRYFPPLRSPIAAWTLGVYNRWYDLPRNRLISRVAVSGTEQLEQRGRNDRLLLTPNHPTHSDPYIYYEATRRAGIRTLIMAAYDVFLRSRRSARIMQRIGCFSVDREGSDPAAMKQAADTLRDGRYALTIFPEGNVYLQNDAVTPFHDGAAFLALRAAKASAEPDVRVLVVPVSIKATCTEDIRESLLQKLEILENALSVKSAPDATPIERVRALGLAALHRNLNQRGVDIPEADTLPDLIGLAAGAVIDRLEHKIDLRSKPQDGLIERIRRARRRIHEIRLDETRSADHASAVVWADEAMLALRIASYGGNYLAHSPTIDRFAETIEKLSEDVYREIQTPLGRRAAYVHFGEPIDVCEYLEGFRRKARVAVRELTERCAGSVQTGLDILNTRNPEIGAQVWNA